MTKFNFFLKSVGLFLFLFVGNLFAQTTITLPAACSDCKSSSNGTAVVSSYGNVTCTAGTNGTLNGTYTAGELVTTANIMTLYVNVMTAGSWSISTTPNNGVTFSGSGTFATTGCQQITLQASGTPTSAGPLIALTNTSPQGSAATTVQPASASNPSSNGTAIVTNYGNSTCANPSTGTINGTMTAGVAVSGVTMSLYANVTTAGSWSLSATQNGVTFTGSGTFNATGCQLINLNASGAPTNAGSFTWSTNSNPVGSAPSTVVSAFNPAQFARAAVGNLSGKTCFDIARSNDNANSCGPLSARNANKSDFALNSVNTQTYTFTPSGTVSNVRFQYVNTNGQVILGISGGNAGSNITNAVTATVSYNNNLNTLAFGLTNNYPLTADIYVIFNDGGTDKILKLTANIKDCLCCGAYVSATQFKEFLCHNLGADITLDPHLPTLGLQGSYIQWGKRGPNITGDSRVDWQTAVNDGTGGFAAAPTATGDNSAGIAGWSIVNAPDNAWLGTGGAKTLSDPCPNGYRLPTQSEWNNVRFNNTASRTGTWTNSGQTPTNYGVAIHYGPDANTKLLTLPTTGYRRTSDGALLARGANGNYWSSSSLGTQAYSLNFDITAQFPAQTNNRTNGFPVRCIAE